MQGSISRAIKGRGGEGRKGMEGAGKRVGNWEEEMEMDRRKRKGRGGRKGEKGSLELELLKKSLSISCF